MRCKDRKTEVAVSIRGFIKCGPDVRVIYRVDQGQATETPWNAPSTCYLALAPSPIPFVRALADDGKVYVRMFDHHGAPHDALFNLGRSPRSVPGWHRLAIGTTQPTPRAIRRRSRPPLRLAKPEGAAEIIDAAASIERASGETRIAGLR
jgi:hypothetical protein